ncbi:MAG: hypothetical protein Q7J68_03685 [Thermoplasmata archaeon]|nr:hypothetical protein [Thermoplasmata archaeon]
MRFGTLITLALALALLAPLVQAQSVDEPRFVNQMLGDFSTPSIVPGHDGVFSLAVRNPDPISLTSNMENVVLDISIYRYATLSETEMVVNITNPPIILESETTNLTAVCGDIPSGGSVPVEFTIRTSKNTPHGSYFSQSSYFVRFMLAFSYAGINYTMASRGFFSDVQWELLKSGQTGAGEINQTYLAELGYDGIIPDSAFSVRVPIPRWPFYALVGLTTLSGLMAFSYHVLDNPGKYPKVEVRLMKLSGRLNMYKRTLLDRFKKPKS